MHAKNDSKNSYAFPSAINLNFLKLAKQALSGDIYEEYSGLSAAKRTDITDPKQHLQQKIRQLSIAKILTTSYDYEPKLLVESQMMLAEAYAINSHDEQAYEHYKDAYDKISASEADEADKEALKISIAKQLINTSFKLKNYHQTLEYINEFYTLVERKSPKDLDIRASRFHVDGIRARVLFELGDTKEAERILKENLEFIDESAENSTSRPGVLDLQTINFTNKCEILNILYKIYKNERNYPMMLNVLTQSLKNTTAILQDYPDRYLYKFEHAKSCVRKITFLQKFEDSHKSKEVTEELKRMDDLIFLATKGFEDLCTRNSLDLFIKRNQAFLAKSKNLFVQQFVAQIKAKDFEMAIKMIEILRHINRYMHGDVSQEHAKTLYLCVKCMIKNRSDKNTIYKYCKKILKICKQTGNEDLFSKTRQLMTSEIDNAVVDISLTEITNY